MHWSSVAFDWNQTRAFLVTAEEGSLSAAARALGLTQPTLGRQVMALEDALGVTLFDRVGRSLVLTPLGLELLDHVRTMGEAANLISLTASGRSQAIEGQVTITATDMMATYILPPILRDLRRTSPGIEVEVVASNEVRDLRRREADIAIRHARPEQPDLIAKLVRETTGYLYAAETYLEAYGRPKVPADLADADFIVYERSNRFATMLQGLGLPVSAKNLRLKTNNGVSGWEMVKAGLGIGATSVEVADMTEGVEPVLPDIVRFSVPVWLVTHRELHTSRRIRLVFDALAEALE